MSRISFSIYRAPAGFGVVLAGESGVFAHHLPYGQKTEDQARQRVASLYPFAYGESEVTKKAAKLLEAYFSGAEVVFDVPLDLGHCAAFHRAVYDVVAGIPYGKVMSYGQVAAKCGSPGAARAVGAAMAKNVMPLIIPCHRVVASNGRLTGFTAPGGIDSKREMLVMEGVSFRGDGVDFRPVLHRISTDTDD